MTLNRFVGIFVILFLFQSCTKDQVVYDPPTIEGLWYDEKYPTNVWEFRETGAASITTYHFGTTLYTNDYMYKVENDILIMRDLQNETYYRYNFSVTDTTATLNKLYKDVYINLKKF